ncbi:Mitogen-activated protein kinase kinase kinase ANP1 [Curvularia clavata]|uniref:Mitogen-activated protein kinase kinase kinase ANP1 n=1 Tax=Curvularia clavata TaxID=95742 RepID=A0A9Q8YZC6_CURCL|nr:Mitogen-activated protein kinase kinase kinase ANP1 [Curvularia clavata]
MGPRFQWPFSMETFYRTHGMVDDVPRSRALSAGDDSQPSQHTQQNRTRRTLQWPFSMDVFYATHGLKQPRHVSPPQGTLKVLDEDESDDGDSLADRLVMSFVESNFDTMPRSFAPARSLERLITPDTVTIELRRFVSQTDDGGKTMAQFICSKAPKTFATAVYVGLVRKKLYKMMMSMQEHGITDDDLPFVPNSTEHKWEPVRRLWSKPIELQFSDAQWKFHVPIFVDNRQHKELLPSCILPITRTSMTQHGAFSMVYKARVHEDHLVCRNPNGPQGQYVALKIISNSSDELNTKKSWHMELEALRALADLNHRHILGIMTSFTRGADRCLMLEWADGGSLVDFWSQHDRVVLSSMTVKDSLTQLYGLADALSSAHEQLNIRHGDLKPANILVFPHGDSIGCLKIGDWGLAKTHKVRTAERASGTSMRFGTLLYEPPEAVSRSNARSRLYDIWSLGCVFLEHIIWLLYGNDERRRFLDELRDDNGNVTFYEGTGDKARQREGVARWIHHILVTFPMATTSVGGLVDLVSTRMLVAALPRSHEASDIRVPDQILQLQPEFTDAPTLPSIVIASDAPEYSEARQQSVTVPTGSDVLQDPAVRYRARAMEVVTCLQRLLAERGPHYDNYLPDNNRRGPERLPHRQTSVVSRSRVDYQVPDPVAPIPRGRESPKEASNPTPGLEELSSKASERPEEASELAKKAEQSPVASVPIPTPDPNDPAGKYRYWDDNGSKVVTFVPFSDRPGVMVTSSMSRDSRYRVL